MELNAEQVISQLRRVETLLFRTLSLVRRLSGSEDVSAAIMKIQQLVMTVRMLHTSLTLLQSTTGVGIALAAVGGLTAVFYAADSFGNMADVY